MKSNITLVPTINSAAGTTYISPAAKGAGYYKSANPLHTVVYSLLSGFVGDVKIQGTLVTNPTDSDWVDISETLFNASVALDQSISVPSSFKGQYVWVRAVISNFTAGSIEKISYSYN